MTIKELYEYSLKNNMLDYEIQAFDNYGEFNNYPELIQNDKQKSIYFK